jgi:hypothetical protein
MINLSKNKCGGQDAHSALIADLKQVLQKYEMSASYADQIAGMMPPKIEVGILDLSPFNMVEEIEAAKIKSARIKQANEISKERFGNYYEDFMDEVNGIITNCLGLDKMWQRGDVVSGQTRFDYKDIEHRSNVLTGRTGLNIWFVNQWYKGEENPVFLPAKVEMNVSMEFGYNSLMHDTFKINSVSDIFTYAKAFFKAMIVLRDVKDSGVCWDMLESLQKSHREIVSDYKNSNPK